MKPWAHADAHVVLRHNLDRGFLEAANGLKVRLHGPACWGFQSNECLGTHPRELRRGW